MSDDQVPRLWRFTARHTDIEILSPGKDSGPLWMAIDSGQVVASAFWLKQLLDQLETMYGN